LRHILTHTTGWRLVEADAISREAIIAALCDAELEPGWLPGQQAAYQVAAGWHLLGEVIRRITGRPFERYVREAIFEPLGMRDSWISLTPEQQRAYGDRLGVMHSREEGSLRLIPWTYDEENAPPKPGGSGYGPIRELGRFYEMLLLRGQRGEARILSPQTVEALTARHRVGMFDHTFEHIIDWGLGFVSDSKQYGVNTVPYGFGPHCSPRTFGHGGSQCAMGFCDPEHELVVAWVCNGRPGEGRHQRRNRAINAAIYEDLTLSDRE
ncbi:MAG: beta-lactamase family protein, partial [Armatimonadota bacterium]|nr:beta-lactamase family protein [Armatimonadota bacterium]